jgi:putative DNA primase/helicase
VPEHGHRRGVEVDHPQRLAEGTVKRLTGGDRVKARRMREDFWHFTPSHTFAMLTNHKPDISGTDEGVWRRVRLIPWEVVVPEDERDEHLGDRLGLELDHVRAWLVSGYRDWRAHGLGEPQRSPKPPAPTAPSPTRSRGSSTSGA